MSLPCEAVRLGVSSSKETILKLERGVEPGWVEIIPLNRVTFHVLKDDLGLEYRNYRKHQQIPDMVVFRADRHKVLLAECDLGHRRPMHSESLE